MNPRLILPFDQESNGRSSLSSPFLKKEKQQMRLDSLTNIQIFGYSIGHFHNDLCCASWLNYTLYFIQNIVFREDSANAGFYAGALFLIGQIIDGAATPIIGYLSDKYDTRYGKRTPWYVFGFVIASISFISIYDECQMCDTTNSKLFYYIFFIAFWNVGFAAMQVAHMSLVPSLTLSRKTRDELNNQRGTFTYVANFLVLIVALIVFQYLDSAYVQFRTIAIVSLIIGIFSSLFFLFTVNEKKLTAECRLIQKQLRNQAQELTALPNIGGKKQLSKLIDLDDDQDSQINLQEIIPKRLSNNSQSSSDVEEHVPWTYWLKLPSFYFYGFIYVAVRMMVNVQTSLIIFYLQTVLGVYRGVDILEHGLPMEFATLPMIVYISSCYMSARLVMLYEKFGRKMTFTLGTIAVVAGAIFRMFLDEDTKSYIYPLAALMGLGQSICLNTGTTLISEVIGQKGGSGAFVFGAYSFIDKVAVGIVLYFVVNMRDLSSIDNIGYVKVTSSLLPGLAALAAWLLVILGKVADYEEGDIVMDKPHKKNSELKEIELK